MQSSEFKVQSSRFKVQSSVGSVGSVQIFPQFSSEFCSVLVSPKALYIERQNVTGVIYSCAWFTQECFLVGTGLDERLSQNTEQITNKFYTVHHWFNSFIVEHISVHIRIQFQCSLRLSILFAHFEPTYSTLFHF